MSYKIIDLGLADYLKTYRLQKLLVEEVKFKDGPDTLIICEHNPVFTLGRQARPENILTDRQALKKRGIKVFWTDRGGDVTYHGPGQIVIYPVFNLNRHKKDLNWYLRKLEQVAIDFLKVHQIPAKRNKGFTGVWVKNKKIASIGIGVTSWITYHGLAININIDLTYFSMIRPCNLNVEMTSMKKILCRDLDLSNLKLKLLENFKHQFDLSQKN